MTLYDPDLLDAIERLGSERLVDVTVWRHMFNDAPPERANYGGARWNPPGVGAIYTAFLRDTALAEGQHAIDSQPLRPRALRYLYEMRLSAGRVLRIEENDLASLGLDREDLESGNFAKCQRVAAHAAFLEFDALIVPSARAQGDNLVILVDHLAPDATLERIGGEPI